MRLIILAAALVPLAGPTLASESWVCTQMIRNKPYAANYQVDGDLLTVNGGRAHSTILENNADRLIAYYAYLSNRHRIPKNAAPVEIDQASVIYTIIEKASGRLTVLDYGASSVGAEEYGTMIAPLVQTQHCVTVP